MKRHLTNVVYGVLDYISYPFGMLLVAPIVIHKLGASDYGLWMIATSVISAGGIIASGFCDASTQRIAQLRSTNQPEQMVHTVQSTLGIGATLGLLLAVLVWLTAPYAAVRVSASHVTDLHECLISLRIAGVLIFVRSIEAVGVSVHRAFESYNSTVKISATVRLLTLFSAAALAASGHRTASLLAAGGVFLVGGTYFQFRQLRHFLSRVPLWPSFEPKETWLVLALGVFVWLQAAGSVVFNQCDRILLGVSLGAVAVAPYALCVQFAHPLFGLTASGLHFLFPYLSGRADTISTSELWRVLLKVLVCNFLLVSAGAVALLLFGDRLLALWAGPALAKAATHIFSWIVIGSALLGLSVTGTYALQALGLFRIVALINLGSRATMLMVMLYLLHYEGVRGLAISRLCYGATALLVYLPLIRILGKASHSSRPILSLEGRTQMQEGATP